jgi:hypothetical protein
MRDRLSGNHEEIPLNKHHCLSHENHFLHEICYEIMKWGAIHLAATSTSLSSLGHNSALGRWLWNALSEINVLASPEKIDK